MSTFQQLKLAALGAAPAPRTITVAGRIARLALTSAQINRGDLVEETGSETYYDADNEVNVTYNGSGKWLVIDPSLAGTEAAFVLVGPRPRCVTQRNGDTITAADVVSRTVDLAPTYESTPGVDFVDGAFRARQTGIYQVELAINSDGTPVPGDPGAYLVFAMFAQSAAVSLLVLIPGQLLDSVNTATFSMQAGDYAVCKYRYLDGGDNNTSFDIGSAINSDGLRLSLTRVGEYTPPS